MLSSITPLGERGRNRSWHTTVVAYVLGSVLGGAFTGLAAGTLGASIPTAWRPSPGAVGWLLAGLTALAAAHELGYVPARLPTIRRQVNEDWLDEFRGWVVGAGFGFQLGAGLTTIVTSAVLYVVWIAAAVTFSPQAGVAIGAVFGMTRALPLLSTRRILTAQQLRSWHAVMHRLGPAASTGTAIVAAVVAVALGLASATGGGA